MRFSYFKIWWNKKEKWIQIYTNLLWVEIRVATGNIPNSPHSSQQPNGYNYSWKRKKKFICHVLLEKIFADWFQKRLKPTINPCGSEESINFACHSSEGCEKPYKFSDNRDVVRFHFLVQSEHIQQWYIIARTSYFTSQIHKGI